MRTRSRPQAGSLPLPEHDHTPPPDPRIAEAREAGMPWIAGRLERMAKRRLPSTMAVAITALQEAREEAEKQAGWLQDLVFNDWIARCLEEANDPREWTQARVLYEDYLSHARTFGNRKRGKGELASVSDAKNRVALQELATETLWGRIMATLYPKKRRRAGWYYPLRRRRAAE